MQDWDTRIKDLKINIQNAREKFVIPHLKIQKKDVETPIETQETSDPLQVNNVTEVISAENKVYVNKDPLSSMDLLNKAESESKDVSNSETKLGLTEEISAKLDNVSEDLLKVENTEESKLTQSEIEFVLVTLRESTFKGTQVVDLYNTVLKLQQQHKNLPK